MCRVAGWTLLGLFAVCGVAHGADGKKQSGKLSRWSAVVALQQGALIEVLPEHQAGPDSCRISSVNDSSLTCLPEGAVSDVRLVFSRSAVRDVWVIEPAKNLHIGRWIMVGIGVALVVAACWAACSA